MNKTFNIYCDESCHIENDGNAFMFFGSISCAYPQVKRHTARIKELKDKHKFNAEIKWSNVSNSKLGFYIELIDYFFDTDLRFRTIDWIKYHIDQNKMDDMLFFSVDEPDSIRTYIYMIKPKNML